MDTKSVGTPVHPPEEILIFQSGDGGISICKATLRRQLNLKSPDDFLTFKGLERIQEATYEDRPQLFITSSWGGEIEPVLELIRRLRRKNQQLVVVLLDTMIRRNASSEFDRAICPNDDAWEEEFTAAVTDFRYGILRRKTAPTAS